MGTTVWKEVVYLQINMSYFLIINQFFEQGIYKATIDKKMKV